MTGGDGMAGIDVAERLAGVRARVDAACRAAGRAPEDVTLIAVSKRQSEAKIRAAIAAGQRAFGENLVQAWQERLDGFADVAELRWHMIGAVQSKKARDIWRGRPALLHTVDRAKLVGALDHRQDLEPGPPLPALIEVNVDEAPQKAGVRPGDLDALVDAVAASPALTFRGLMCIPEPTADGRPPRAAFAQLRRLADAIADRMKNRPVLSMGMSGDFEAAIAEGATHVRVGTAIFGPRG